MLSVRGTRAGRPSRNFSIEWILEAAALRIPPSAAGGGKYAPITRERPATGAGLDGFYSAEPAEL